MRQIVRYAAEGIFPQPSGEIAVHLVSSRQMGKLNEQFLQHAGPTDVITFDHTTALSGGQRSSREICGEIFVSPAVAQLQAPRYRTTRDLELVRHILHGLLHLAGKDDRHVRARRAMKKLENRWLHQLRRTFSIEKLSRPSSPKARGHPT